MLCDSISAMTEIAHCTVTRNRSVVSTNLIYQSCGSWRSRDIDRSTAPVSHSFVEIIDIQICSSHCFVRTLMSVRASRHLKSVEPLDRPDQEKVETSQ